MNSDDWFEDLDTVALEEIDALEAAALAKVDSPSYVTRSGQSSLNNDQVSVGDSFDLSFNIDEDELHELDRHVGALLETNRRPVLTRVNSTNNTRQTTLDGGFVTSPRSGSQLQKAKSTPNNTFGQKAPKTKKWDHTEFAKTGTKPVKKTKGKSKFADPDGWDEDEDVEFDQFPAPFIPIGPPPPMKLISDLLEAKHWLYPLNKPKRDYQFNIVKRCLFDNTLVSLPTGLGKTFIAGSVMLNYYRWFPQGKVVFVAPTKPLVAQQINACHKVCGIPGSDAVLLTGAVQKHFRAKHWNEKRVFYMTPQTLRNDLYEDTCDAMDIILLVIDEAHRATGGYAYNEVMRFLMAKNPHFRVLALTATPGSTPEAVQNLIDGLHISHVEIRDENSIDIRQYLHEKHVEQHIILMNDEINRVKDLLVKVMDPLMPKLKQNGILFSGDLVKMHPFLPQSKRMSLPAHQRWASLPLTKLSTLARAMGYLLEGTISMCHTFLHGLIGDQDAPAMSDGDEGASSKRKRKAAPKQPKSKIKWRDDTNFMAVMGELESQRSHGFQMHPKMAMLKELLVNYFERRNSEDETQAEEGGPSKAMIFVTYRDIVDDIVKILDECRPIIRASKFVGQGSDKQGGKGMSQKKQLEIIQKFQSNEYNVLVATSVGEEGLDIGEVDFIVCYDAQKTPIRMLQRLGRTGRQRDGIVHVLLAEHREEFNMEKAKMSYKEVQKTIWRGDQLELYADVERLLPQHVKPECVEKMMEITPYVPEQPYNKKTEDDKLKSNKAKRKRNDDIGRNIPLGASTGFVRASELTLKGTKKRKTKASEPIKEEKTFDQEGIDDDTDMELESGVIMSKPRRTKSSTATSSKSKALKQTKLRKYATLDSGSQRKRTTKAEKKAEDPASSLSQLGKDDSDDMDIEQTISLSSSPKRNKWGGADNGPTASASSTKSSPKIVQNRSLTPSSTGAIIDLDSDTEATETGKPPSHQNDLDWLVEHDDEMSIQITSSPPVVERRGPGPSRIAFDANQSVQSVDPSDWSPEAKRVEAKVDESIISIHGASSSPLHDAKGKRKARWTDMPPPDLPPQSVACQSPEVPAATFPVKKAGKARAVQLAIDGYSSPTEKPLKRLHRHASTSTPVRKKRKEKLTAFEAQDNPIFDVAADHSGEEVSEGASGSEDDVENDTDRMFIKNSPLTQVSGSYDQSLVYRQSLLSQAPSKIDMPTFGNGLARPNLFGPRRVVRPIEPSSSPARDGSDEYEFGSFVVRDE
ncbi:hypothetical protein JOM56_005867 [Amanita muscaria]